MKRIIAKIVTLVGAGALSYGAGYAWAALLSNTIGNWFLDEEKMDSHPVITFWLAVLFIGLLAAAPIVWAFGPAMWLFRKANDLIDKHFPVEDDWDEERN
jgi:hypothetical protein